MPSSTFVVSNVSFTHFEVPLSYTRTSSSAAPVIVASAKLFIPFVTNRVSNLVVVQYSFVPSAMLSVLATPKFVLAVAALARSLKLFAIVNAPAEDAVTKLNVPAPSVCINSPAAPSAEGNTYRLDIETVPVLEPSANALVLGLA